MATAAPPQTTEPSPPLPRITVLGSINADMVSYVARHPAPGETLTSTRFAIGLGGKGANQAAAMAKLATVRPAPSRVIVTMHGAVGGTSDPYAGMLFHSMAGAGVDVTAVRSEFGHTSGVAVIIVEEDTGENRIVLSPGANHSLRPADYAEPGSFNSPFTGPRGALPHLLVLQLEIPVETVVAAIKTARQHGIPVVLNAAPAPTAGIRSALAAAYAGLDHLIVNETEAAALAGLAVGDLDDADGLARAGAWFVNCGVTRVVVTLGARGAFWMAGPAAATRSGIVPAAKAGRVVDTTAAGDTFVGAYALEVVEAQAQGRDFSVEEALRVAVVAAAKAVERRGGADSVPWGDEVAAGSNPR